MGPKDSLEGSVDYKTLEEQLFSKPTTENFMGVTGYIIEGQLCDEERPVYGPMSNTSYRNRYLAAETLAGLYKNTNSKEAERLLRKAYGAVFQTGDVKKIAGSALGYSKFRILINSEVPAVILGLGSIGFIYWLLNYYVLAK